MDRYLNVLNWDIKAREILERAKKRKASEIRTFFLVDELIYVCTHRNKIVRNEAVRLIDLPDEFLRTLVHDRAKNVRFNACLQVKMRGVKIRVPSETLKDLIEARCLNKAGRCLVKADKSTFFYEDASV